MINDTNLIIIIIEMADQCQIIANLLDIQE